MGFAQMARFAMTNFVRHTRACIARCRAATYAFTLSAISFVAIGIASAQEAPAPSTASDQAPAATVLIVVGAPGEEEYQKAFEEAAGQWKTASDAGKLACNTVGIDNAPQENTKDRDAVLAQLEKWKTSSKDETLWLVMIGHGTTSKQNSNFNLRGEDISLQQIASALKDIPARVVIAACFSTGGAWVPELAGPNRITIAATKSGAEYNYSRFARYFAESINDLSIDLDHDREVSLLEAFLSASRRTAKFYQDANRLASEHAILDDNGDGKGTTVDFYEGLQPKSKAAGNASIDGELAKKLAFVKNETSLQLTAEQLKQRDDLEVELEQLRKSKSSMSQDDYYAALEQVLLRLGRIYHPQSAEDAASL
jgi:hypothetical protein